MKLLVPTFLVIIAWADLAAAQSPPRLPVLIDTDIGSDVDDAFALALALASPELDIRGITTVGGQAEDRAWIVCRFLSHGGFGPIPVAFGRAPQPDFAIDWQIQYRRHPAPIFNRTQKPQKEAAADFLFGKLKEEPGKLTLIALGPLTNIAQLLKEHPDAKPLIRRIVLMGGSIEVGYKGEAPAEPEWNIKSDVAAAQAVFRSGVPLTVVPLDATVHQKMTRKQRDRFFSAHTPLTLQVQTLYELWDKETPILFDPVALAAAYDDAFLTMKDLHLEIDAKGMTRVGKEKPNARVAVGIQREDFVSWLVERVRAVGKETLPAPPGNLSKLVERGRFPAKVHVTEDYDTDIEKRWWMTGRAETKDVPHGGRRAQRGVLTQDFDDRQGQLKTSYRAVVFNPVPGPPMGKNTRLSFRYKLSGTDRMRVQLYTLTNGYHRYLSLEGLPQGEWRSGAVDMTHMRRPDGTGGPLAENERIDDIQFYVDPRAELLIDDVVLYDAAAPGEERPFPERILFTGWFDTGKQGKEWPGDFDIVPHEKPRTWKAARSVKRADGDPWIRLHLRGERRLGTVTGLSFKYHLAGADHMRVELVHAKRNSRWTSELKGLARDAWAETTASFAPAAATSDVAADEIHFLLPRGATLTVDDVLLYVP